MRALFATYTLYEIRAMDVFRGLIKKTRAEFPIIDVKFNVRMWDDKLYMESVYRAVTQQKSLPTGIDYQSEMKVEVNGAWIGEKGNEHDLVILFLHGEPVSKINHLIGGAFVLGHALIYVDVFNYIIRRLKKLYGIHCRIFSVEYPLAPENVYPSALNCATATYWLLARVLKCPRIIIGTPFIDGLIILKVETVLEEI